MRNRALHLCGTAALGTILTIAGCHKSNGPGANDPALANLAPANGAVNDSQAGAPQYGSTNAPAGSSGYNRPAGSYTGTAASQSAASMPPPPPEDSNDSQDTASQSQAGGYADEYAGQPGAQGASQDSYAQDDGYDQTTYAESAPPPLPEYEQPPCPGDNYLWTPGYWNYAQAGYYWVPGIWAVAPFIGALWTPGYWGYDNSRYAFHHGYWGHHIGFYGGISYGYGYFGRGYEGGYWNRDRFYYNRSVTRVGNVRNVYVHNVDFSNRASRISYNGGHGGINMRPAAYEQAAAREQHFGALAAQREHVQQAMGNRAQFAGSNGGRPQTLVANRALGGRTVATAAAANLRPVANRGGFERNGQVGNAAGQRGPDNAQHSIAQAPRGTVNAQNAQRGQLNQNRPDVQTQRSRLNTQPGQPNVNRSNLQQQRQQDVNRQPNQQMQQRQQQVQQRAPQDQQRVQQQNQQRVQQQNQQRVQQQNQQQNQQRIQQQNQQRVQQQNQQRVQQQNQQQNQQRVQQQNQQRTQQQNQQRVQQQNQQRTQQVQQQQQQVQQRAPQEQQRPQQTSPQTRPQEQHAAPQQAPHAEAPHGGGSPGGSNPGGGEHGGGEHGGGGGHGPH